MTVKELIKELEKYDKNAVVKIYQSEEYTETVKDVRQPKKNEINNENIVIITNY